MKLFTECWLALLDAFNALTGTPTDGSQQSLGLLRSSRHGHGHGHGHAPHYPLPPKKDPLKFTPPSGGESQDSSIVCDYTAMGAGWRACSQAEDRGCWLQGPGDARFDINTDYEFNAPIGITRKVLLYISRCLHHHDD